MKNKRAKQTFPTGVRVRNKPSKVKMQSTGDGITLKYTSLGDLQSITTGTSVTTDRKYIPGYTPGLSSLTGPNIASNYSTGVFKPGTTVRWEPACGATTSGRVYVAWTDNPELMAAWQGLTSNTDRFNLVAGCGTVRSFPVWQETEIPFPAALRRKRFDVNSATASAGEGVLAALSRSAQCMMMAVMTGPENQVLGQFNYHDVLHLEGMVPDYTYLMKSQLQHDTGVTPE